MKKGLLVIVLACTFLVSFGNIMTPRASISEIQVYPNGSWTIELGFSSFISEIESVTIQTNCGSATIILSTLEFISGTDSGYDSLALITNENLSSHLTIDPSDDFVKVTSESWGEEVIDLVLLGDMPGSFLSCYTDGSSISYLEYYYSSGITRSFCIDQSPTIGAPNDTTGALGTFAGKLYDLNGELMTNVFFSLPQIRNTVIHVDSTGSFSERIFAREHFLLEIEISTPPWPYQTTLYSIEAISFCLSPDSTYTTDIITRCILNVDEEELSQNEKSVVVAPNPFTSSTTFYFNFEELKHSDNLELRILSQEGKICDRIQLTTEQKELHWQPNFEIKGSILFYQLFSNQKLIKSGKILKL